MNGWPNQAEVKTEVQLTPEQQAAAIANRNAKIQTWRENKAWLDQAKAAEMAVRTEVTSLCFPTRTKGTQRIELGNGYNLKLVQTYNYTLGDKDKVVDGLKVKVRDQVDNQLDIIEKLFTDPGDKAEVGLILDRLIKWSPELSQTEYEKLGESRVGLRIKEKIDEILTVKEGSPQLTFEEPKVK